VGYTAHRLTVIEIIAWTLERDRDARAVDNRVKLVSFSQTRVGVCNFLRPTTVTAFLTCCITSSAPSFVDTSPLTLRTSASRPRILWNPLPDYIPSNLASCRIENVLSSAYNDDSRTVDCERFGEGYDALDSPYDRSMPELTFANAAASTGHKNGLERSAFAAGWRSICERQQAHTVPATENKFSTRSKSAMML
jgi:hypothetical protein